MGHTNFSQGCDDVEIKGRVLVLDDEPLVRLMARTRLEQLGAWVSEAGTCMEAFDLACNTDFQSGVFDYRLPDGNGLDLVRQLRKAGVGFPVVILSGEALEVGAEAEEGLGICAVLPKPFDAERVAAALATASSSVPAPAVVRTGRYLMLALDLEKPLQDDWLAIDLSGVSVADILSEAVVESLRTARRGAAVVGASDSVRAGLLNLGLKLDFLNDTNELAALSRRPTSPSERNALLGGGEHA
jgi:CheY-like chemotaxis protein